jgi:hypothetical protein
MKIDLSKLDSQIRKLEELRRIASDPEMLALLDTVIVKNGVSPVASSVPAAEPETVRKRKGEFQSAVRNVIEQYDKPFSGYSIARKMELDGYKFASSRPGIAVIEALKALIKKGIVRVFREGAGSEPTLYVRVQVP